MMKGLIEKLGAEIDALEERVNAKETVLKCVFSTLESTSSDRQTVHNVLGVTPKAALTTSYLSLEQQWCLGFEDTICLSFSVMNTSTDSNMQAVCHSLDNNGTVRSVLLDEKGSCIPFISSDTSAELIVGVPKSVLFGLTSGAILLELIEHPLSEKPEAVLFAKSVASRTRLSSETRIVKVSAPSRWLSFADFPSAMEQDMLILLRCLRVACSFLPLNPTSSFDFAEQNQHFDCCDFGDWQVYVGHHLMSGLVAVSSTFDHSLCNIDRIYGRNHELLEEFAKRYR